MKQTVRWGILSTGSIAAKFAEGLAAVKDAQLVAVGSRSPDSARRFARRFSIPRFHGSYEALAADPDIDIVYIGTPHPMHCDNTLLCLDHGKAVLCEKPFAMNTAEAERMISAAARKDLFLMEAMWTHCFPAIREARRLVSKGKIGDIRMVKADFCFRAKFRPEHRLFNHDLGGGALLDVGCYAVAFAQLFLPDAPVSVSAVANLGNTGVDEQTAMTLGYKSGAMAILTCAVRTATPHEALIVGTDGWIRIPHPFWQTDHIYVNTDGKDREVKYERLGNGYSFEAEEATHCLRKHRLESTVVPHSRTVSVMRILDQVRAQIGLKYPAKTP